ncbi:hypothetical protein LPJ77_001449 [Coemansia sp. RSA 2523]|nr:hypothetical protein LPJ54_001024 [Coemansia sp. RSA 1824]KAJ1809711.1 hypothetical protein LPJ77_001449 [Coemansia sp. RSA 2523]KAJ2428848.1 hypothetical protein GGF47_001114 [Coemansia sp. RSA 2524]
MALRGLASRSVSGLRRAIWQGGVRSASHVSPLSLHRLLPLQGAQASHRKLMSHVPDYEAKYRDKLVQKAREKGVDTVEQLKQQIKEAQRPVPATKAADLKRSGSIADNGKTVEKPEQKPDRVKRRSQNLPPDVKSLDQVMKLDMLNDKTCDEISEIWTQYHANKDTISAAIPTATYQQLLQVARKNPIFVLPLPREGQGVEFYFLQFDYHQVHFTSLIEYKTNQSNARPFLTLTHYTDFIDRGVVLMRGEVDSKNMLNVQAAQLLALLMQQFYITGGEEKRKLLETFNQRPDEFDYRELLEAAEKI